MLPEARKVCRTGLDSDTEDCALRQQLSVCTSKIESERECCAAFDHRKRRVPSHLGVPSDVWNPGYGASATFVFIRYESCALMETCQIVQCPYFSILNCEAAQESISAELQHAHIWHNSEPEVFPHGLFEERHKLRQRYCAACPQCFGRRSVKSSIRDTECGPSVFTSNHIELSRVHLHIHRVHHYFTTSFYSNDRHSLQPWRKTRP
jgi:hypothetical protein